MYSCLLWHGMFRLDVFINPMNFGSGGNIHNFTAGSYYVAQHQNLDLAVSPTRCSEISTRLPSVYHS
jgi:hypothetical protein